MISAAFGRSPSIHRIRQMFTEFARSIDIEKLEGMARMFGFDPEKMPAARQFLDNMRKAKEKAEKDAGRREPPGSPLGEIEAKGLPGAAFSAQGINFALPVSQVFYSARVVRAHGHAIRYGINVHMPEADVAKKAGLAPGQGLVATGIIAGGRCDRAGVKEGDILLSVAGRPVGTPKELFKCMLAAPVTGSLEILLLRDGERKIVEVSLDPM